MNSPQIDNSNMQGTFIFFNKVVIGKLPGPYLSGRESDSSSLENPEGRPFDPGRPQA